MQTPRKRGRLVGKINKETDIMITVKSNNYTTVQLRALSEILHIGLVELMSNHCSASCEECVYAYVCNDVESTLKFLDNKIKENRDKLMENSKS